jgi:alkylation response protein AidB-like acyl-CoA dehydrogenase
MTDGLLRGATEVRDFTTETVPAAPDEWLARAREVAALLGAGTTGAPPHREIQLLKDAGLVTVLGPPEHGGGGQEWAVAEQVVRLVSAVHAKVGEMLGYHYVWSWIARFIGTDEKRLHIAEVAARAKWFFTGAVNMRAAELAVSDAGEDMVFNGRVWPSVGGPVSDITILEGFMPGKDVAISALVLSTHDGLTFEGDLRSADTSVINVVDVVIPWTGALGYVNKQFEARDYNSYLAPTLHLMLANVYLGLARGALEAAVADVRARASQRNGTTADSTQQALVKLFGELTRKLWAAEALADSVSARIASVHQHTLTSAKHDRGEYAVKVSAVKAQAVQVVDEVLGEMRAVTPTALRYQEAAEALASRDPAYLNDSAVGRYQLNGELPEPTWRS